MLLLFPYDIKILNLEMLKKLQGSIVTDHSKRECRNLKMSKIGDQSLYHSASNEILLT